MRYLTSTIITLSVLISGFALALPAFAQVTCPQGNAYPDGCATAPAAGAPQDPSLLNNYGTRRPAWNVAGVDYAVGVPTGTTLKNPSTISMPGVSVNATSHTVTVTGNNVTLDAYDFSLNGGWGVIVQAANTRITNSNFVVGSNDYTPISATEAASHLYVGHSIINGSNKDTTPDALINMQGPGLTAEYDYLKNGGENILDANNGGTVIVQYNLMQGDGNGSPGTHGDYLQSVGGPFIDTVSFNTIDHRGGGSTHGLMVEPDFLGTPGVITSADMGNNTMVGGSHSNGGLSYFMEITVPDITNIATIHDNLFRF